MSLSFYMVFFFEPRHNPRRRAGPKKLGTIGISVICYIKIIWLRTMVTELCLEGGVVECEHPGAVDLG